jgi:uncharacterized protein YjgD (DUF1641 family)
MFSPRRNLLAFCAVLLCVAAPALAAIEDLPGMDTAANMKEWLKLSDEQVQQLQPVIATRVEKLDAELAKLEAAKEPDVLGFIEASGKIRKEFDDSIAKILTPDQLKQWASFKAEAQKDLVQESAKKQSVKLQTSLKLSDEQTGKIVPPLAKATQGKLDAVKKISNGGRISMRDKLSTKKAMESINSELDKALGVVLTGEQMAAYKAAKEKK